MIPRNSKSELRFSSGLVWLASWMKKPLDWETEKVSMKMRSGHRAEGQRMMGDIARVSYRPGAWWRLQDVLIKTIYIWKRERTITGKAEEATLFYRRIWHLFHGSTLSHHRAEYLLCGSQHLMSKLIKHWKTLISQRVTHWHRTKTRHVMKGRRAPLVEHSLKCLFTDYQILNRGEKYKLKFLSQYLLNIHHGFR